MNEFSRFNIQAGRWFGIPLIFHWTWVLFVVAIGIANPYLAAVYLSTYALVILHEFGHCLAGRRLGYVVDDIVLYPIGGCASMAVPARPWHEILVTAAGPAVNLAFVPVLWLLGDCGRLFADLATVNLVLLVFNLVPAFPMDGGRLFRATLTCLTGRPVLSTVIAARTGQVISVGFVVAALYFAAPMLFFAGLFVFLGAAGELRAARLHPERLNPNMTAAESTAMVHEAQRAFARYARRSGRAAP